MASQIFKYYTLPDNNAYGASIPITSIECPIAELSTHVDPKTTVSLRVTVGWEAVIYGLPFNRTDILFRLWRGASTTGKLICSAMDSGELVADKNKVITFAHVDYDFDDTEDVTYTLTAQAPLEGRDRKSVV